MARAGFLMTWLIFEPAHEIMALFVPPKIILQTHMRSHQVGLDVWFFCLTFRLLPYFMCANSAGSDEAARARRLAWAFACRLYDKCHNLMSWLVFILTTRKLQFISNNIACHIRYTVCGSIIPLVSMLFISENTSGCPEIKYIGPWSSRAGNSDGN